MFARASLMGLLAMLATATGAASAWAGLNIQHWTTPQGARVFFVENHELPMLDVSAGFAAGSAQDDPQRSGLAGMTQELMPMGAGDWDEAAIAERLADVGALLNGRFEADLAEFRLRTLSSAEERSQAMAVFAVVLARPRFPAAVVEREKARAIANLRESATQPEFLGERAFQAAIYGAHPYALPDSGTEAGIARIAREDLVAFHQRHYVAGNMALAIMGDVTRAEAERLADDIAAALPAGPPAAALPPVPEPGTGSEQVISHHASQSHVFVGLPGITRDDPDYFPLVVGNYILGGGGFDSRLLKEIREQRGLAYSVSSTFMPQRQRGPFVIGLQTRRDATGEAVAVVRETLARYLREGPSEAELQQAKDNLVGGFPLRLDSNSKILDYLAMIGFYGLPLDWLDTYPRRVEAVTREAIVQAFRQRLRPEAMSTIIVGGQTEPVDPGQKGP